MLKSKNKLLRKGRLEQADALAVRIGVAIGRACAGRLVGITNNSKNGSKLMWEKVREITGKRKHVQVNGIDPVSLNMHYAYTSTDLQYQAPVLRHTCCPEQSWPTEHTVFRALEQIKPTSPGLDGLPAWYLKLAAPALSEPLAWLFIESPFQTR